MGEERAIPLRSALGEPLVATAACFAAGIGVVEFGEPPLAATYGLAAAALLAWMWREGTPTMLLFAFAAGGLLHHFQTGADRTAPFFENLERGPFRVTAGGVVVTPPKTLSERTTRSTFQLRLESLERDGRVAKVHRNRIHVTVRGETAVAYGDRLEIGGLLNRPRPARNPAQFDFAEYLRSQGIHAELSADRDRVDILGQGEGNPLVAVGLRCRDWIAAQITRGLEPDDGQAAILIKAMTLGAREDAPEYLEDKFRFSGTLHIFAVSGLHVGIVAAVVWFAGAAFFPLFGLRRHWAIVAVIVAVLAYALVTGLRPSACRAAVMGAIFFGGMLIGREPQVFNSTGAAALVILLFDSGQLFRPGFQLSFCVLLCIAAFATPISRRLARPFAPDPFLPKSLLSARQRACHSAGRKVSGLTAMSLAASIGSSPLTWLYFGLVTPVSVIANLLLIPLAFLVLGTAAFSVALALVPSPLPAELANHANALWAKAAASAAGTFSAFPAGHWSVPAPGRLLPPDCELTVLDLPYGGAATHIAVRGGGDWLIDSGSDRAFRSTVHPLLRSFGTGRLDGMVLTHGDVDHVGGSLTALAEYRPKTLITTPVGSTSPAWREAVERAPGDGVHLSRPSAGGQVELGRGNYLKILYPPADEVPGFVADDRCLVVQLCLAEGTRVLFTGDSGFYTERWLLENCEPDTLRSDVLIKGQHGTDLSGLPGFIDAVAPRVVVISGALRPPSERPREGWSAELQARGIELFDQAESGAVSIRSRGTRTTVEGFLSGASVELSR